MLWTFRGVGWACSTDDFVLGLVQAVNVPGQEKSPPGAENSGSKSMGSFHDANFRPPLCLWLRNDIINDIRLFQYLTQAQFNSHFLICNPDAEWGKVPQKLARPTVGKPYRFLHRSRASATSEVKSTGQGQKLR